MSLDDPFKTLESLKEFKYYSLPSLEKALSVPLSRLPVSIRIMLESLLRNCDGARVKKEDVERLAHWNAKKPDDKDVPLILSRVVLQDFTGVPLLVDLAAMRDAMLDKKLDPQIIEPVVPVDLVVDHSVQVDRSGRADAFLFNLEIEFQRNEERYEFLRWGQDAFKTFKVVPPGIGIVHQVNLEYLASVVRCDKNLLYFDTLVGTDSHTTMINGLGVLGWGVGGIEAEAAMLGQPYFFQTPEVVGVHLSGSLKEGVTATDLTLRITELLRAEKVVGKFVEFFGEGASTLSVADRATIGNMAPEYGATMGFFPVDHKTLEYLALTGRSKEHIQLVQEYLEVQKMFGIPKQGEIDFSKTIELDLSSIEPCVSGPKRPQDRINISSIKTSFKKLLAEPVEKGGYGKTSSKKICVHSEGNFHIQEPHITGGLSYLNGKDSTSFSESEMVTNRPQTPGVINPGYMQNQSCDILLDHGSVVIAAITSCTNTSNPSVMVAAGLLAKKAIEHGLSINHKVKTSLAPGSRVVTDYLEKADLQKYLDQLGFQLVAYGCTTCIGNSGPLDENIENAIKEHDLVTASVLSGNRNFEARIHGAVKANFLMSPPLVIAFALAGRIDVDFTKDPVAYNNDGKPVFLKEIWPSNDEIEQTVKKSLSPQTFKKRYEGGFQENPLWLKIKEKKGAEYGWQKESTYIQKPPFFEHFSLEKPEKKAPLKHLKPLALFGDSITTDHISPAGNFKASSPAGEYLISKGIEEKDFNSYGSRRGNHNVMMRGTFANVRIKNLMMDGKEGGWTKLMPEGTEISIFEAAQTYAKRKTPLIIFAGKDYGMGSSRDWAAKGTALLGVKAVVAESFERIHRSNLVGMGVLPLQFKEGENLKTLKLKGTEEFHLVGLDDNLSPHKKVTLEIVREDGSVQKAELLLRLDTSIDIEYYLHGGILPYVLRQLAQKLLQ